MGPAHLEAARLIEHGSSKMSAFKQFKELRILSTQNFNAKLTDQAAAQTAIATGIKVPNGHFAFDHKKRLLTNFVELLRLQHPEYLSGVVSKLPLARLGAFLGHSNSIDDSEILKSIHEYAKADLILSGGNQNLNQFKELGWNVINSQDYEKDTSIIEKTKLPLLGTFSEGELMPQIQQNEDTWKKQPNISYLMQMAIQKFDQHPFFLAVQLGTDQKSFLISKNISTLAGEAIEADYLVQQLLDLQKKQPNLHILQVSDCELAGLAVQDHLDDINQLPIPDQHSPLSQINLQRQLRISKLNLTKSTDLVTNAPVLFAGTGPIFKNKVTQGMTALEDVFKVMVRIVNGRFEEVRPFDKVIKNKKGMFDNRPYNKTVEPVEPKPEVQSVNVGLCVGLGILGGLVIASIVVIGFVLVKKYSKRANKGHIPLMDVQQ